MPQGIYTISLTPTIRLVVYNSCTYVEGLLHPAGRSSTDHSHSMILELPQCIPDLYDLARAAEWEQCDDLHDLGQVSWVVVSALNSSCTTLDRGRLQVLL